MPEDTVLRNMTVEDITFPIRSIASTQSITLATITEEESDEGDSEVVRAIECVVRAIEYIVRAIDYIVYFNSVALIILYIHNRNLIRE